MNLKEVNITYDETEDRLLFRFSTSEEVQYAFFITRLLTKKFLALIDKFFDQAQLAVSSVVTQEEKNDIKNFQHEKMLVDVNFKNDYQPVKNAYPPVLLHKIVMRELNPFDGEAKFNLSLVPDDVDKSFHLTMHLKFLHSIYQLIMNALKQTDWAIGSDVKLAVETALPKNSKQQKIVKH